MATGKSCSVRRWTPRLNCGSRTMSFHRMSGLNHHAISIVLDMQPPEPMVRILAEVEEMPAGAVLFALLHREPLFLFPELENRGHEGRQFR